MIGGTGTCCGWWERVGVGADARRTGPQTTRVRPEAPTHEAPARATTGGDDPQFSRAARAHSSSAKMNILYILYVRYGETGGRLQ